MKHLAIWKIIWGLVLILIFLSSSSYYQQKILAYNVIIGGEVVGQVKNEKSFTQALDHHKSLAAEQIGREVTEKDNIQVEKARIDNNLLVDEAVLEQFIQENIILTTKAYSVTVDGTPLFSVLSKKEAQELLEQYKSQFVSQVDEGARIVSVDFVRQVEIVQNPVEIQSIVSPAEARQILSKMKEEEQKLEVQKGDNLWTLARKYNTTVHDIVRLNPEIIPEKIMPGDQLVITPGKPILEVVAIVENEVEEEIQYETEYHKDSNLLSQDRKILQKGANGKKKVLYRVTLENGYEKTLEAIDEEIIKEPVKQIVRVGTKKTLAQGVKRNYGVVQGKRVSSGFGWRRHPIFKTRRFHDGIDITASYGNGVYAYTSGVVSFAGWNGGYGKVIYIDHGNGLQTRYAHLSKIYVRQGQKVSVGQKIGAVGSTGLSTGPHLHFEVRKYGKAQNPWDYI